MMYKSTCFDDTCSADVGFDDIHVLQIVMHVFYSSVNEAVVLTI